MLFNPIVIVVTLGGLYMLFRLRAFFIFHPIKCASLALAELKDRETRRSMYLALAGTLGVGNVLGVCVGLTLGGAGSVVWMLVSSLFASTLKYCEVVLSSSTRGAAEDGGMHLTISKSFSTVGGVMAKAYALVGIALSLVMGTALQCRAVSGAADELFDTPPVLTSFLFTFLLFFALFRGTRIIKRITAVIVPLTTIIYIFLTLTVIFVYRDRLMDTIGVIFSSAFTSRSAVGGSLGFLFSRAVSEGYSRGILSNEAGAGTSCVAHTSAPLASLKARGILGILEVFFDTVVLCSLTALAVISYNPSLDGSGLELILDAIIDTSGVGGGYLVSFCILAFAYSTVICWYYYGRTYIRYLCPRCRAVPILSLYLFFALFSAFMPDSLLFILTDSFMLVLTALTTLTVIKSSDRIVTLSELDRNSIFVSRRMRKSDKPDS